MKKLFLLFLMLSLSIFAADDIFKSSAKITVYSAPPIKIDGIVSEIETKHAAGMYGFCNLRSKGILSLVPADAFFNVSTDGKKLFISAICETGSNGIVQRAAKGYNSRVSNDDAFEFIIIPDITSDKITIYQLIANNKGGYYTIAKKDGNPIVWKPAVEIKGSIIDKKWHFELALPLKEIGINKLQENQTFGLRICRNWKRLQKEYGGSWGLQSSWSQLAGAFFSNYAIPQITFKANSPVVRFLSLRGKNKPDAKISIFNPTKKGMTLNVRYAFMPSQSQSVDHTDKITLKPNEIKILSLKLPQADINETVKTYLSVTSADGKDIFYRRAFNWTQAKDDIFASKQSDAQRISVKYAFYPSTNQMYVRIDGTSLPEVKSFKGATLAIYDKNNTNIAAYELSNVKNGIAETLWQLPDLAKHTKTLNSSGDYIFKIKLKGIASKEIIKNFQRKVFDWENNKLGTSDRLLPGFTPVKIKNNTVETVLRKHEMNNVGLFSQITADGRKLLKNNGIFFEADIDGKKVIAKGRKLQILHSSDTKAALSGKWQAGKLNADALCDWEFDGVMKYTLKLKPFAGKVNSLKMVIPLDSRNAYLFHACTDGLRFNYGGKTPDKWNSTQAPRSTVVTDFVHYIWLGTESAGLSVFADSDKSFVYKKGVPAQQIYQKDGVTYLVYNLISSPIELKKEREFVIGFQATPIKPMPENWRKMVIWSAPYAARKYLDYDVNFLGSSYRYGGITGANCLFPRDYDLSLWHTMAQIRKTNVIPEGFLDKWVSKYKCSDSMRRTYRREVNNALNSMRHKRKVMQYLNARGSRTDTAEAMTFMDDWFREEFQGQRERTPGYGNSKSYSVDPVKSFRDFSAYWYHKMLTIGITDELYWDDIFLSANYDRSLQSNSYYDDKGVFHPSVGLWNMRELVRRGAVLQMELGITPNNMVHMTNTAIAPICGMAQQNLDGEDNRGTTPFQKRYSKEYLRTLTIGRQFGNLPGSLGLTEKGSDPKAYELCLRSGAGVMLTHEITWIWHRNGPFWPLRLKLYEFGYGKKDVKVYNYWEKDYPIAVSGDTSSIVLSKNNEAQIIICNYGNANDFTAELNTAKLNLKGKLSVRNGENNKVIASENNIIKFNLPKYDFIYLTVKGE